MAESDTDQEALGSWENANLELTARIDAGVGADDAVPREVRFVANVAKLIRRRLAQTEASTEPNTPGIFLFCPDPPAVIPSPTRVPMLDNGLTAICGRIWFVSAGPGSGRYVDYNANSDEELFNLVSSTYGLKTTHAVVFDPRTAVPEVRYYPRGLDDPDKYHIVSISTEEIDLDRVLTVVQAVYKTNLVTPDGQPKEGKLWRDQEKWRPSSKAEAIIQLYLVAALAGAFPVCTIRHEQFMPEGRLDIEIEQSDPIDRGKTTRHAILELKVLRSFTKSGNIVTDNETLERIKLGVEQAAAYRDSKNAKWSALFCFDMRKKESAQTCFNHVADLATSLRVSLRCWYLYATSELYRHAIASAAH